MTRTCTAAGPSHRALGACRARGHGAPASGEADSRRDSRTPARGPDEWAAGPAAPGRPTESSHPQRLRLAELRVPLRYPLRYPAAVDSSGWPSYECCRVCRASYSAPESRKPLSLCPRFEGAPEQTDSEARDAT